MLEGMNDTVSVSHAPVAAGSHRAAQPGCRAAQPGAEVRCLRARQTLYHQGDVPSGIFAIQGGTVKLVRHLPNGRARIVGLWGPGALLGDRPGVVTSDRSSHSAVTLTRVTCEFLTNGALRWQRMNDPHGYVSLLERINQQNSRSHYWLCELSTGPIWNRIARLIQYLSTVDDSLPAGELEMPSCQEIAEMLAVAPESISRAIAKMKRQRLITRVADDAADPRRRFRCDSLRIAALAIN